MERWGKEGEGRRRERGRGRGREGRGRGRGRGKKQGGQQPAELLVFQQTGIGAEAP